MPIIEKYTLILTGGLMRCCIETAQKFIAEHEGEEFPDGFLLDCRHEPEGNRNILFKGGYFQWSSPRE